jgi:hypothetical protein
MVRFPNDPAHFVVSHSDFVRAAGSLASDLGLSSNSALAIYVDMFSGDEPSFVFVGRELLAPLPPNERTQLVDRLYSAAISEVGQ